MKAVATVLLCACLPLVALADQPATQKVSEGQVMEVEHYNYGMDLDVERVISIKRNAASGSCGVAPVDMVYEDSSGKQHDVEYLTVGTGCGNG